MFMDSTSGTGDDLLDRAIDYHGLELIDAIQRSKTQTYVSTASFLFAGDPENDVRKKAHNFIAKNVKLLFKERPPASRLTFTKDSVSEDDYFAAMPPLETFMGVGSDDRLRQFKGYLEKGDVMIGRVVKLKPGQGFLVSFLCLDCGKKRDLVDLGIRGFCPQNCIPPNRDGAGVLEIFNDDYIRGVVISVGESEGDVITISMLSADLPDDIRTYLGPIEKEDLPAYYRMIGLVPSKNYSTFLTQIATSSNCVKNLMKKFGLNDDQPTTFIKSAQTRVIPKSEYADELRKTQSHRWSLKSVKQGVDQFKKAKFVEAMQHFNRALEIDAQNAEALVARGALFANNNNYPKAIEDFERALEINAHHVNAKNYMCQTLVAHGKNLQEARNYDEAMVQYQKVLAVNPGYRDAENCIRELEYVQGRKEGDVSKAVDMLLSDSKRKAEEMRNKTSRDALEETAPLSPTRKDIFGVAPVRARSPDDFEQAACKDDEFKMAETFIQQNKVFQDYPELKDLGMDTMLRVLPRIYATKWTSYVDSYKQSSSSDEKANVGRKSDGDRRRDYEDRGHKDDDRRPDDNKTRRGLDRDRMDSVDRELYGEPENDEKKHRSVERRKSKDDELYSGMMNKELSLSVNRKTGNRDSSRGETSRERPDVVRDVDSSGDRSVDNWTKYSAEFLQKILNKTKKETERSRGRSHSRSKQRSRSRSSHRSHSRSRQRSRSRSQKRSHSRSQRRSRSRSQEKGKTKGSEKSRKKSPSRSSSSSRSSSRGRKSKSRSRSRSLNSREREAEKKYLERLKFLDESIEKRKKELLNLDREKSRESNSSKGETSEKRSVRIHSSKDRSRKRSSSKSSSRSRSRSRSRSEERRRSYIRPHSRERSGRHRSRSRSNDKKSSRDHKSSGDRKSRSRSRGRRSRSRSRGRRSRSRSRGRKSRSRDRRSMSRDREARSKKSDTLRTEDVKSSSEREVRLKSDSSREIKVTKVVPTPTMIPPPRLTTTLPGTKMNITVPPVANYKPQPYSSSATHTLYSDIESVDKSRAGLSVDSRSRSSRDSKSKDERKSGGPEVVKSKWDSPDRSTRWDNDNTSKKRRFQEETNRTGLPATYKLDVFSDYPNEPKVDSSSSNPLAPPATKKSRDSNGVQSAKQSAAFVPRQLSKPAAAQNAKFSFNVKSVKQVQKTKMDDKQSTLVGKLNIQSAPDVSGPSSKGSDSLAQMENFLSNLKKMKGTADLKNPKK